MTERRRYDQLLERFLRYHAKHPEVWELFQRYTLELIRRGFPHHAVATVIERIRWDSPVGADGRSEFKISNDVKPFYARAFAWKYPQHADFFHFRPQTSKDKPATDLPESRPGDFDPDKDPAMDMHLHLKTGGFL